MPALRARRALPLLLLLATSSCATDSDSETAPDRPATSSTSVDLEAITAQGIAGVLRDALGADRIVSFSDTGRDGDSVAVLATLAGPGRQRLAVSIQLQGEVPDKTCTDNTVGQCVVGEDGTVTASDMAGRIGDEDTGDIVVSATSLNQKTGRYVLSMFVSGSRPPEIDPATLAAIVSNPALAAMTDPTTNEAGSDIELTPAG